MLIYSIDFGSYGIKILEGRVEKKHFKYIKHYYLSISSQALPLTEAEVKKEPEESKGKKNTQEQEIQSGFNEHLLDFQLNVLKDFMKDKPEETLFIFQTPVELLSNRFKIIPVKSQKKARQIIPFQLEEDIPYSIAEIHLNSQLDKVESGHRAICLFTRKETFRFYVEKLKSYKLTPYFLTHEMTGYSYLLKNQEINENVCILDIGHQTTKAYFYHENNLVSYNVSYIAGHALSEMIVAHYKVSLDEANDFKHKSGFILTDDQYADVDEKQKEFAKKMNEVLIKLISDFKRWELTLKINHNLNIDKIYLCGGTSLLRNIDNYIAQKTNIETLELNFPFFQGHQFKSRESLLFYTCYSLSLTQIPQNKPTNLLSGEFREEGEFKLPLHSISFVGVRTIMVTAVLLIGLILQGVFLSFENDAIEKKVKVVLENPQLELGPREKNLLKKKPDQLLKVLTKRKENLVKSFNELTTLSALTPLRGLEMLSHKIDTTECSLLSYQGFEEQVGLAAFGDCSAADLNRLQQVIKAANLKNLEINADEKQLNLEFNF